MMRFISPSRKETAYSSVLWRDSETARGVRYAVRRISLGQRIELTKRARELSLRNEFLRAGDSADQLEASLADLLIRQLYLEWALVEIEGLKIDGEPATVDVLVSKGPEALTNEILTDIRSEIGLTEDERKNS
jgi:hypothetical protein